MAPEVGGLAAGGVGGGHWRRAERRKVAEVSHEVRRGMSVAAAVVAHGSEWRRGERLLLHGLSRLG